MNAKSACMECLTWVISFCSDSYLETSLNEELGRHSSTRNSIVKIVCFVSGEKVEKPAERILKGFMQ